ncbi:MAG: hypothetical protein OXT73_02340 [Bacteroidota bacterium]|nr:hypothetical protein [Bacteroidota bacterium]
MRQISNKSGSWLSLRVLIAASHALMRSALAQQAEGNEGRYAYLELIGKGFISVNVDWKLGEIGRLTTGLTLLEY